VTSFEEDFVRRLVVHANPARHLIRRANGDFHVHQRPICDDQIRAHLNGGDALNVYLLKGTTTQLIVFDLDNKSGAIPLPKMIEAAEKIKAELDSRGLRSFVATSGSGLGAHCWLVFRDPQDAALAQRLGVHVLTACGLKRGSSGVGASDTELFPKQSREGEKGGNAIALPLGRKSRLVLGGQVADRLDQQIDFETLLNDDLDPTLHPPPLPKVKSQKPKSPVDLAFLRSVLKAIPADDYNVWIEVGMVLRALEGDEEEHFALWKDWAATADDAGAKKDPRKTWATFSDECEMTVGTLVHLAKDGAWEKTVDDEVAVINLRYGILAAGNRTSIIDKDAHGDGAGPLNLIGPHPLRDRLRGQRGLLAGNKSDPGKEWMNHERADRYEAVTFDPSAPPGRYGHAWNIWQGYGVIPSPGDWSPFRQFLREVIAGGDTARFEWLMNWLALMFQDAAKPIGTALVMTGAVGIGKGFFANAIGHLWGRHYAAITDPSQVQGKFNGHMVGRRFLFIDECVFGGSRETLGNLKTRITEPMISLERKGHDAVFMPNRAVFAIASNEASVVAPDRGDRRFMLMPVSACRQHDRGYFEHLTSSLEDGGYGAMLSDLLRHDVTVGPNARRVIKSNALFAQWLEAANPYEQYLFAVLEAGELPRHEPGHSDVVTIASLWADFTDRNRLSGRAGDAVLARYLQQMLGAKRDGQRTVGDPTVNTGRSTAYQLPTLPDARRAFEHYVDMTVLWSANLIQWGNCRVGQITS
jgi:hypothetical protein